MGSPRIHASGGSSRTACLQRQLPWGGRRWRCPPSGGRARYHFAVLNNFHLRGDTNGVGYCIAGAKPYALEFSNTSDVICLLLGDINSSTKFEDDRGEAARLSAASPPRSIRESAMCAFARRGTARLYRFQLRQMIFRAFWTIAASRHLRRGGSCNNIRNDAIKFLARYVRERLRRPEGLQPLELQFLALGTYVETMRQLETVAPARRDVLSDQEFATALRLHRGKSRGQAQLRRFVPGRQPATARRLSRA